MARRLLLLLGLGLFGCVTTPPPTPDSLQVVDLRIEGTRQLKQGEVKERILTAESPWLSTWLPSWLPLVGDPEWFDPIAWQADLRRIQRFYEANGYYQARVLEDQVTPVPPKKVKLLVRLREGAPARVNTVELAGLEGLPEALQREVTEDLPLREGDIFLEDAWSRTKKLLASRLRERGYAEAQVSGEALVDAEAARVDLLLTVEPGLKYRFGKIFVATDPGAQVPPRLIADVASPDVKPGDSFSESALAEAQARVFQMGVFGGVKVNRGAPDRAEATVPVVIDVREAPFRSVRLGGGLGGDLIRQEVRLVGEYTNRNLGLTRLFLRNARLDRLTLKAKLGWAFLPNVVAVATNADLSKTGPTWRLFTEYEIPRLFELRTLAFQGSVDVRRTLDNTYNYDSAELKLGVVWRPRVDLAVFPSINLNGFLLYTPLELRDSAPGAALGCPVFPQVCAVGFFDVTVEHDRRDNKLEPREGYFLALDVAAGLSQTSQLRPFFKVTPEARGYVSVGKHKTVTFAGRLRLGTLLAPDNDAPVVVRYFSGGANMRGFYQRRLSPLIAVPSLQPAQPDPRCAGQPNCPSVQLPNYERGLTLPVGGSGLLEAALEVRWNLSEDWVLALFNDWGLVTTAPLFAGQGWGQSLYTAVGLGVRYRTPLGPIRFDLGVRLPFVGGPQEVDSGQVKEFVSAPGCFLGVGSGRPLSDPYVYGASAAAYGGSPDNLCSVHLSIGEAF